MIIYASRQLKIHEQKYPKHDLLLTLDGFALKIEKHYLYSKVCEIFSDHQSLKYMFIERFEVEAKAVNGVD